MSVEFYLENCLEMAFLSVTMRKTLHFPCVGHPGHRGFQVEEFYTEGGLEMAICQ